MPALRALLALFVFATAARASAQLQELGHFDIALQTGSGGLHFTVFMRVEVAGVTFELSGLTEADSGSTFVFDGSTAGFRTASRAWTNGLDDLVFYRQGFDGGGSGGQGSLERFFFTFEDYVCRAGVRDFRGAVIDRLEVRIDSLEIEPASFSRATVLGSLRLFGTCTPSQEVSRPGTPPNPDVLLPGQTRGPAIGMTWDPRVDHSSFFPGATHDLLFFSLEPTNVPTLQGTLLCKGPVVAGVSAAGEPFSFGIPYEPRLVGIEACFQVASSGFARGEVELTNALDVVVGTHREP